jgi:hypothetical protein
VSAKQQVEPTISTRWPVTRTCQATPDESPSSAKDLASWQARAPRGTRQ